MRVRDNGVSVFNLRVAKGTKSLRCGMKKIPAQEVDNNLPKLESLSGRPQKYSKLDSFENKYLRLKTVFRNEIFPYFWVFLTFIPGFVVGLEAPLLCCTCNAS